MSGGTGEGEGKEVADEKRTLIKSVECGKEVQLEKDITKALYVVDIINIKGEINLSDDAEEVKSKQTVTEEKMFQCMRLRFL